MRLIDMVYGEWVRSVRELDCHQVLEKLKHPLVVVLDLKRKGVSALHNESNKLKQQKGI